MSSSLSSWYGSSHSDDSWSTTSFGSSTDFSDDTSDFSEEEVYNCCGVGHHRLSPCPRDIWSMDSSDSSTDLDSDGTISNPEELEEESSMAERMKLLATVTRKCQPHSRLNTSNKYASRLTFTGDNFERIILTDATIPYSALLGLFYLAEEVSLINVECKDDEAFYGLLQKSFTVKKLELGPEYESLAKWFFKQPDPSKLFGKLRHLELEHYSPRLDWMSMSSILDKLKDTTIERMDVYLVKDPIDETTPLGLRDPISPHNLRVLNTLTIHIDHEFSTAPKHRNIYVYAWYLVRKFLRRGFGVRVQLRVLGKTISIYREKFGHQNDSDWDFDRLSRWLRRELKEWPCDMMLETMWLDDGRPTELLV